MAKSVSGSDTAHGLVIAAPASGHGKTTITLGLVRALGARGCRVAVAKAGPDYIDPQYHAAAGGEACVNLDTWAMRPALVARLARDAAVGADLFLIEGVMGLFDGASGGGGSTADLAVALRLPVVLVIDAHAQAQSVAAVVQGFAAYRDDCHVTGIILNRVASPRHEEILRTALAPTGLAVLGAVPAADDLALPSRHLGLVQAAERPDLEAFLVRSGTAVAAHVDLAAMADLAAPLTFDIEGDVADLPPLGQRIAVAQDHAFSFAYPHLLDAWRRAGAEIIPFSPLADVAPDGAADAVFLPGGYPELHAGRLAANAIFLDGLRNAAQRGMRIYGECGGYMVLGRGIVDAEGDRHAVAALLPLETSFATRRLHLGYRQAESDCGMPWKGPLRGHEFHYATVLEEGPAAPLYWIRDTHGGPPSPVGSRQGSVMGSFIHIVDCG
ncbi:MAG: cobyrinate a,c-diamide synthase [Alphaproteobacteria bacterium]|nr:cobyrinate a,c-diamide synthase [Alphaproteobacteria bacterium]